MDINPVREKYLCKVNTFKMKSSKSNTPSKHEDSIAIKNKTVKKTKFLRGEIFSNGVKSKFKKILGIRFKENKPLKNYTTFKVGGPAEFLGEAKNINQLKKVISLCIKYKIDYYILGRGSNLLISDNGIRGVVIRLSGDFEKIKFTGNKVKVGAAVGLGKLLTSATNASLGGVEFLWGIPGTSGGAVVSNAGVKGHSIQDIIENVGGLDCHGRFRNFTKKDLNFDYRRCDLPPYFVITSLEMSLQKKKKSDILKNIRYYEKLRKESQPKGPSAGCIFKNPLPFYAGQLIEKAGLKGYQIGQAQISKIHANFIMNRSQAKASDIWQLICLMKRKAREKFGIDLELEIKTWGRFY